jgi:hypothetical protein
MLHPLAIVIFYISESYEVLLQGSRGIFGGELSDERTGLEIEDRGGIIVNISDAGSDGKIKEWSRTNGDMDKLRCRSGGVVMIG